MLILDLILAVTILILFVKWLNAKLAHNKAVIDYLDLKAEYHRLYELAKRLERASTPRKPMLLDQKLVKDLIVFCHPDKHGGSEKSIRLTQELLKIRDAR